MQASVFEGVADDFFAAVLASAGLPLGGLLLEACFLTFDLTI
jgi:hypothetical protein